MPVLQPMPLADYTSRIFQAAGTPKMTADLVGQSLVSANLAGHDSHGVIRIMQYLRQIDADEIRPLARPEVERETAVMALLNGHRCFGQLAAKTAIETGISKARGDAVAAIGLKHSGHVGRLGEWVELAAEEGLIALAYANGGRSGGLVAPFGGAERRMGTNPVAAAIPLQDRPSLLLDFATSAVAEGKVRVAMNGGKPIPEGLVLDKHGRPTRNPADLYDDGMLLPAAGHKGYSLALLTDLLGGVLTGAGGPTLPGTILGNGCCLCCSTSKPSVHLPNSLPTAQSWPTESSRPVRHRALMRYFCRVSRRRVRPRPGSKMGYRWTVQRGNRSSRRQRVWALRASA